MPVPNSNPTIDATVHPKHLVDETTTEIEIEVETSTATTTTLEEITTEPEYITFRVTAYCSCEICCGKWANNRPLDKNGNEIVIGSSGERLVSGISCASPLPFGTKINLDGLGTYIVQDKTADWVVEEYGEDIIDIYVDSHEDIYKIGLQYVKGVIDW